VTARDDVLTRIRSAVAGAPPAEVVPRDYRRSFGDGADIVSIFAERVADYKATVRRVGSGELAAAITAEARGRRVGVPAGLPADWRSGLDAVVDAALPTDELDALDGAVTGCRLGIAETGTIVLDGGERSGRRALTLVPDWHLCVVQASQVVGSVPQAISALEATVPITFISGPSATSDIELNRVEGVHGPRTLVVLLVG